MLRCRIVLVPLPVVVLGLCALPSGGWEAETGTATTLLPEILASSLLVLAWLVAVTVHPYLQSRAGPPLGSPATTIAPVPRSWLQAGILVGSGVGLLLLLLVAATAVGVWHFPALTPTARRHLVAASLLGSMGGIGLLVWTLLLCRHVARPVLVVITALVLLGGLSPSWAGSLPLGPVARLPFFPVSPESLTADDLIGAGAWLQLLGSGALHLLGLALLAVSLDRWSTRRPFGPG